MSRYVLLSFDVEEFDFPLEYNQVISVEEQMEVGKTGLEALTPVLGNPSVPCTLFTTANYAMHFPEKIKKLSEHHEIASHTFYHSTFSNEDLLQSRQTLEKITGQPVKGLRMPRMRKVDMDEVAKAGYYYDSSINPTYLPGRYNNLLVRRTLFKEGGVYRLPVSVSPVLRIPLFWLSFKNFPYPLFYKLCQKCIRQDGYVFLYFHPWEFADIKKYQLPGYSKNICGEVLLNKLEKLISDLSKDCSFITTNNYIGLKSSIKSL